MLCKAEVKLILYNFSLYIINYKYNKKKKNNTIYIYNLI